MLRNTNERKTEGDKLWVKELMEIDLLLNILKVIKSDKSCQWKVEWQENGDSNDSNGLTLDSMRKNASFPFMPIFSFSGKDGEERRKKRKVHSNYNYNSLLPRKTLKKRKRKIEMKKWRKWFEKIGAFRSNGWNEMVFNVLSLSLSLLSCPGLVMFQVLTFDSIPFSLLLPEIPSNFFEKSDRMMATRMSVRREERNFWQGSYGGNKF